MHGLAIFCHPDFDCESRYVPESFSTPPDHRQMSVVIKNGENECIHLINVLYKSSNDDVKRLQIHATVKYIR